MITIPDSVLETIVDHPDQSIPELADLCLTCGCEVPRAIWGGLCKCGAKAVHQVPCDVCGRVCGTVIDDDYCGVETMVCPDCMDKSRLRAVSVPDSPG